MASIAEKIDYVNHPDASYVEVVRRHIEFYPECECTMQLTYRFTRVSLGDLAPDCNLCGVGLEWGDGWYYDWLDSVPGETLDVFEFARVTYEEVGKLERNSLCGCCFNRVKSEFAGSK